MTTGAYIPNPIDTSDVSLPDDIKELIEFLALNTHETWAKQRIEDGWKYGALRNDMLKEHPCLVPYDQLPEEEKQYDRNTACETLRVILKYGFNIEKSL